MPEQNKNNIPLLLVGLIIVMIMVITIIYNWTDDEPSTSTADKDKEPEPDLDENRTDLENREGETTQKDRTGYQQGRILRWRVRHNP